MKIRDLRLVGIRCFEDTGDIVVNSKCNIFVGRNNAGKSSLLKAILGLQGFPFDAHDIRPKHSTSAYFTVRIEGITLGDQIHNIQRNPPLENVRVISLFGGNQPDYTDVPIGLLGAGNALFPTTRPHHTIVPFLAKRKAVSFDHNVSTNSQSQLTGTLSSLYSRIDLLATYGHPDHDRFREAVSKIVGHQITTNASSGGKQAGYFFDKNTFVTLERMGDGVSEMVALIVELCTEQNKIFVLEEPETNLHPQGLKALLAMIRAASDENQFFISTHSNVVVRELGGIECGKVFRVYRDGVSHISPTQIEEVEQTPSAHMDLLRELGYEFTDLDLYSAWLFLEESSAERVIRDILIPMFAPALRGKLRTYSAGGVDNLEPSVSEFQRLVVFVHLQPVYTDRLWIRADGGDAGVAIIIRMRASFPSLNEESLSTFEKAQFEHYYPEQFQKAANEVLAIEDKQKKRRRKTALLQEVLDWTAANADDARAAWEISAHEPIQLLHSIQHKILT